jgi:lysine 2,3-aminomutase
MVGPGKATALSEDAYRDALDYIRTHPEVWEVILTGGDPLMLSPRRLKEIMADLAAIDHVKIIRIHTRVPVVDPTRVSAEMVAGLRVEGATTWIAVHANHPRELTDAARAACARLTDAGIPLVSQSVLLRGVNDDAATLEALMRAFVECRIKPYYLHHGDLAPGTSHLRTTIEHGQELMRKLRGRVSGLCQPDYVLDIPGGHGKAPIGPNYLSHANSRGSEAAGRAGQPQRRKRGHARLFCGAGGGGNLVTWLDGRSAKGAGLCRPGPPE